MLCDCNMLAMHGISIHTPPYYYFKSKSALGVIRADSACWVQWYFCEEQRRGRNRSECFPAITCLQSISFKSHRQDLFFFFLTESHQDQTISKPNNMMYSIFFKKIVNKNKIMVHKQLWSPLSADDEPPAPCSSLLAAWHLKTQSQLGSPFCYSVFYIQTPGE